MKIEDELLVRFIVMGAEEASSSHPKRTPLLGAMCRWSPQRLKTSRLLFKEVCIYLRKIFVCIL